jgi:Na+-transporting NADH:ubiquinone oxidoreductase subunit F
LKWASYSISSSPEQKGLLEFCIGGGSLTGVSHKIKASSVGEKIKIKGPFGIFKLKEDASSYVLIAMGTGIAPIISMIRTLLARNTNAPVALFFGFRFLSQYLYREELERLQKEHESFTIFPVVSRPEKESPICKGHVQDVLKDFSGNIENASVYICGTPQIAEEIRRFCVERGFKQEKITIEKW